MPIYEMTADSLKAIPVTRYGDNDIKERGDLQRILRDNIEVVSPDTLIIAEEFSEWDESKRRIDLLGVDKEANLVVIELKRSEDGGHMDLQAIRYASMIANMPFEKAVDVFGRYLKGRNIEDDPLERLIAFLGREESEEVEFADDVRIVLVSAEFGKELTTSVMWLNERDLDIRCVKMVPYKDGSRILVDVQQVIPLPETADYQVRLREKDQKVRKEKAERHGLRNTFWTKLLETAKAKTDLHSRISPNDFSYISAGSGIRGLTFNYTVGQFKNTVELYMDRGSESANETKEMFDKLLSKKDQIEASFGEPLDWQRLDGKRACRICATSQGGYRSDESQWPDIQTAMVNTMVSLEKALRPHLERLRA